RPDVTVVRRLLPAPVGVQILRAGDVVRDVLARGRVLQLTLTPRGPAVQIIRSPQGGALISDRVRAGEGDPLLSADGDRLPAARPGGSPSSARAAPSANRASSASTVSRPDTLERRVFMIAPL